MAETFATTSSGGSGVGDRVGEAAGSVAEKAQEVGGQVAEKAQEVGGQVAGKLQEAGGKAGQQVRQQLDQRSTEAGHQLDMTSSALRKTADELRSSGNDLPARLTAEIADRSESLAAYLRRSDADTILADIERAGRAQPWAVIAGGIALGFMGSRFLKASSRRRYQGAQAGGGAAGMNGGAGSSRPMAPSGTSALPGTAPGSWPPPPPAWSEAPAAAPVTPAWPAQPPAAAPPAWSDPGTDPATGSSQWPETETRR